MYSPPRRSGQKYSKSVDQSIEELARRLCDKEGIQDARGSPRTTHNLPFAPNPAFTGREADLESLGERLVEKRGEVALTQTVALHGLGGVGKTQLAVEYAWRHLGGYEAVLWVRADSLEALDASLAGLAKVLGLPEASAPERHVQTKAVLDWLNDHKRWLLVADNADSDEAVRAVRDRFAPHLGGHVVVTSRISRWPLNWRTSPQGLCSNGLRSILLECGSDNTYYRRFNPC